MTRDGVAGLICLALSIGMLVLTPGLPKSSFVPFGPDFYPRIVLVIMLVLSVSLIVLDLWSQRAKRAESPAAAAAPAPEVRNYRLVGVTYAVFTGYVVLLPLVGFRVATFVFVVALQAVFESPRGMRRWAMVTVSGLATALITYIVFNDYLSVLLPRGAWTGW